MYTLSDLHITTARVWGRLQRVNHTAGVRKIFFLPFSSSAAGRLTGKALSSKKQFTESSLRAVFLKKVLPRQTSSTAERHNGSGEFAVYL